jgi:Fic family protein
MNAENIPTDTSESNLLAEADAAYKPFPSFGEWSQCRVDLSRWHSYVDDFASLKTEDNVQPEQLRRALETVKRHAAIETGVIENLYPSDRGLTFTVAEEVAIWESVLAARSETVRNLIEAQLAAYDYALDFVTGKQPIAQAWIRQLHAVMCRSQETYRVQTPVGEQEQPLPLGEYKTRPNHVKTQTDAIHSYAPVLSTSSEMQRLCDELRTEEFLKSHPVLQASYAHYAFVAVHPFRDGNGRVARALASVFTYRDPGVPLLIVADNRREYFDALEAADAGNYQRFVDFVADRVYDAIRLVAASLKRAAVPAFGNLLTSIESRFTTRGGYAHEQVDNAGHLLVSIFSDSLNEQIRSTLANTRVSGEATRLSGAQPDIIWEQFRDTMRWPVVGGRIGAYVQLGARVPVTGSDIAYSRYYILIVPKNCGQDDNFVLFNEETGDTLLARVPELLPTPTLALEMMMRIEAERVIAELLVAIDSQLTTAFQKAGY